MLVNYPADFSDREKQYLLPEVIVAEVDSRDLASMTIRKNIINSKNASFNFNLNDTLQTSFELKETGEMDQVEASFQKYQNMHVILKMQKLRIRYSLVSNRGMEAEDSKIAEQMASIGINEDRRPLIAATYIAMYKLMDALARFNTISLVRAVTRDEQAQVNGQRVVVTADEMGVRNFGYATDAAGVELDEGISIYMLLKMTSWFAKRLPSPFRVNVAILNSPGQWSNTSVTIGGFILLTPEEICDLQTSSTPSTTGSNIIGNLNYVTFMGFDSNLVDGTSDSLTRTGLSGILINGFLAISLGDLYTDPALTALDLDSEIREIPGDSENVEIDRKIIIYHPSSFGYWEDGLMMGTDKITGDGSIYDSYLNLRTDIAKMQRNAVGYCLVKRKIPNPNAARAFAARAQKAFPSVGGSRGGSATPPTRSRQKATVTDTTEKFFSESADMMKGNCTNRSVLTYRDAETNEVMLRSHTAYVDKAQTCGVDMRITHTAYSVDPSDSVDIGYSTERLVNLS